MPLEVPMERVLFVCLGNICRSPFVEHILKRELGSGDWISSAGTLGNPMTRHQITFSRQGNRP